MVIYEKFMGQLCQQSLKNDYINTPKVIKTPFECFTLLKYLNILIINNALFLIPKILTFNFFSILP